MNLSRLNSLLCHVSVMTGLVSGVFAGASELPKRLVSPIDDSQTYVLVGNTQPLVHHGLAIDLGPASGAQPMPRLFLHFSLTKAQSIDLAELLQAQQDRRSPHFHKFLTPPQFAARFGVSDKDIGQVTRWLEERGFSQVEVARGRTWVSFSGTVGQVDAAFQTGMHQYSMGGQMHLANSADPSLPKALEGLVAGMRGLHDFHLQPRVHQMLPRYTQPSTSIHYLAPDDWETIYDVKPLYTAGLDGTGVRIAVVGQSDVQLSDIAAFRSAAGLPARAPTVVIPAGQPDPGIQSGDELESDLDLEWAGAIAKNATIVFITSPMVQDAIMYAIDNNVAPILSTSYGDCELDELPSDVTTQNSLYQQANAQGMTILAAAGDQGATDCDSSPEGSAMQGLAVDFPASSPYVTGVGGTEFNEGSGSYWNSANNAANGSVISYIPETVWNDGFQKASGGGFSIFGTKPSWQTGPGVPVDNARDVPDIAFTGSPQHDGYLICGHNWCSNGFLSSASSLDVVGGTSTGPPSFAGLLALVIQKNGAGTSLGNINPNLYSLAQSSTNIFHDTTQGNNKMACQAGTTDCASGASPIGYSAAAGYDQTTGWGSIDAYNFAEQYYANIQLSSNPTTLTIQPGTSATATVTVTPLNAFSGNVAFACSVSNSLTGVTCSVPGTVSTSGTATVTITAASTAHLTRPIKTFRLSPPPRGLTLLVLLPVVLAVLFFAFRGKERPSYTSALYAASSACLVAIALGAVSCGGGGSTTVSIPATTELTLALSCNAPVTGTTGAAYSGGCTASGGTAPLIYSISGGALPAGLSINATTGAITGTPTAEGAASFMVKAADSGSPQQTASDAVTITVAPVSLTLSCTLPTVTVASPYSGSCVGAGGTAPVSYSISAGALPSGLSINAATGVLTGIPTAIGASSFTVKASDSSSPQQTATQAGIIMVAPAVLSLTCTLPATATVASAYTGSCVSAGGTTPTTYSISSGTLPAGLSINSATGVISGIPTAPVTSSFAVKASDSGSPQQMATYGGSIVVVPPGLTLSCSLPGAALAVAYSGSCLAAGGTTPITYSVSAGSLPTGLSLNPASGAVTGTASVLGTSSFTVKVSDSGTPQQTATAPASIVVSLAVLSLSCTVSSNAAVMAAYNGSCVGIGGTPPLSYSVSSGTLPPGLSINAATGAITGIPTIAGSSSFTVKAKDNGAPVETATQTATITVAAVTPLTLNATLNAAARGQAYSAQFIASGGNPPYTYAVSAGALPAGLSLNPTSGVLSGSPTTPGNYSFSVRTSDSSSPVQNVAKPFSLTVGPQFGTVTITATSGGIVATTSISVTVP